MEISHILWLPDVEDKIESKHSVTRGDVEEVFSLECLLRRCQKGHFRGEDVYRALGRSAKGRYLTVFFIYKLTGEALILSARDMDMKERKSYAKR